MSPLWWKEGYYLAREVYYIVRMKMTVDMDKFPKMADLNTREVDINVVKQTLIKLAVGLCRLHLRKITCNEY